MLGGPKGAPMGDDGLRSGPVAAPADATTHALLPVANPAQRPQGHPSVHCGRGHPEAWRSGQSREITVQLRDRRPYRHEGYRKMGTTIRLEYTHSDLMLRARGEQYRIASNSSLPYACGDVLSYVDALWWLGGRQQSQF